MSRRASPIEVAKLLPSGWMLNPERIAVGGRFKSATFRSWPFSTLNATSAHFPFDACRTAYKDNPSTEKPKAAGDDPLSVF